MKKVLAGLLAVILAPAVWAEECEEAVDMADSLDFHKMHIECNEDPVVLYDPKSKSSFFKKKAQPVDTYGDAAKATAASSQPIKTQAIGQQMTTEPVATASVKTPTPEPTIDASNAGVVFNIREPFTLTGGPQSALNGLFVQMANYCPAGWEKIKEWSVPNGAGYYLHYQFQCAE